MQFDQRQFDPSRVNQLTPGYAEPNSTSVVNVPQSPMGKACDSFSGRMEQLEVLTSEIERKFGPLLRAIPPSPEGQCSAKDGNVSSITAMIQAWDARAIEVMRHLSQVMDRADL